MCCGMMGASTGLAQTAIDTRPAPLDPLAKEIEGERFIKAPAKALEQAASPISGCPITATGQPDVLPADDVELSAGQVEAQRDGVSTLSGDVQLRYGGLRLSAPTVRYNAQTGRAETEGGAEFANQGFSIGAAGADIDVDDGTARFDQANFAIYSRGGRGSADTIELRENLGASLSNVRYTTCAPEEGEDGGGSRPDWELRGSKITLRPREGLGTASHARLWFKGVPIMYAPYFYFPIDDRRRSGFLVPDVGDSANTGFDISVPFYLNLAPAYDATVTTRYMARRGLQLKNRFRYLLHEDYGAGTVGFDFLPRDETTDQRRSKFDLTHRGRLSDRWGADIEFIEVSDAGYFEDLGSTLDLAATTHLKRQARLAYQAPAWFSGELTVEDYQTIDRSVGPNDEPYRRAPRLAIRALSPNAWNRIRAGLDFEATNFERNDAVEGLRVDLNPALRYRLDTSGWFLGAQANYRMTHYSLRDRDLADPTLAQDLSASTFRSLPTFVADGGLRFERNVKNGLLQTLEPRLQYVYTPFREQDEIPIFDSALPDFSFVQLFTPNRFLGIDRIADTNQVTAALASRLIDVGSGRTLLEAELGQIYRLQPSRISLPQAGGQPAAIEDDSEVVGTLRVKPSDSLSLSLGLQYDEREQATNRGYASVAWRPSPQMRFDTSYRFRRDVLEQTDLVTKFPVSERWSLAGRWNYSLRDNQTRESLLGVEYRSCCWVGRVAARRYIANTLGEFNTSIYFQLELTGLTRVGTSIDSLLPR